MSLPERGRPWVTDLPWSESDRENGSTRSQVGKINWARSKKHFEGMLILS